MGSCPLIFNLFPRYFNRVDEWASHLDHIAGMGFNYIYVNPFHATGFSGSLYAVQDYYRLNPFFLNRDQDPADWTPLKTFVAECEKRDISVMMDLVINHTAVDSVLVDSHPQWFAHDNNGSVISPFAIDPGNAGKVTVWGDLAKIDHEGTQDKVGLRSFFDDLVRFFQDMNIRSFRCDAAYQVPADFWQFLIVAAKMRYADTLFFAETLGCRLDQIEALKNTGFDYLFNSSKWWQFDAPWCLEQHESNRRIAPSISFPETHDTERLAGDHPGTVEIQKARYVLAALFSEGLLITMGFEYGARIKTDVVKGTPGDAQEEHQWDISRWICETNRLKQSIPVLCEEGSWEPLWGYDDQFFFMEKQSARGNDAVLVGINKKKEPRPPPAVSPYLPDKLKEYKTIIRPCLSPAQRQPFSPPLTFGPGEIVIFVK